jgi:hypothetical protein
MKVGSGNVTCSICDKFARFKVILIVYTLGIDGSDVGGRFDVFYSCI